MWHAKPSGSYNYDTTEGTDNILAIKDILVNDYEFDENAVVGVVANIIHESGLNPWRWQSDTYPPDAPNRGCGLFQYTPYATYLAMEGSEKMNLSVTQATLGASATVGIQQVRIMAEEKWGWVSEGWRTYWSKILFSDLYTQWVRCASTYGSNGKITLEQFKKITNPYDATLVFLACFEGPPVPNYFERIAEIEELEKIIITKKKKKMPVWMMIRLIH